MPKELPPERRRDSLLNVRLTTGELARLDAHVAALNNRGDRAEVKRAALTRRAILRALRRAEERMRDGRDEQGDG